MAISLSESEDQWRYSKRLLTQHYWISFFTLFLFCPSSQLPEPFRRVVSSSKFLSIFYEKLSFVKIHLILSYLNPENKGYLSIHLLWNYSSLLARDLKLMLYLFIVYKWNAFPGWSSTIMRFIKNLSKIQTKTLQLFLAKTRCWEKEFVQFIRNHQRRKSRESSCQQEDDI